MTRHDLEYHALRTVIVLFGWVPRTVVIGVGGLIGRAAHLLDRRHRRIAHHNLAAALPETTPALRRRIVGNVFAHFGRLLCDLLVFASLSRERMEELTEIVGEDRVRDAYAKKRGVLFFTGHFGVWELHAIVHAFRFRPIGVLARPLDNPRVNALLEQIRSRTGNTVIYKRRAIRPILRTLEDGEGVALLIDQHVQEADAVDVDFFGRPASTMIALGVLAQRTGATVIPVFAVPLPKGRYQLIYDHAVEPPTEASREALQAFMQRCSDVLESYVRRYPHLWLWMHRRWRSEVREAKNRSMCRPQESMHVDV